MQPPGNISHEFNSILSKFRESIEWDSESRIYFDMLLKDVHQINMKFWKLKLKIFSTRVAAFLTIENNHSYETDTRWPVQLYQIYLISVLG